MVRRHEPRLRETDAGVVEQRVDDRWQRIEAERGELRLLGRFRPRGSFVRRKLPEDGLVELAVRAGGLVSCHGLALVEDLRRRHRPEGNESLQRCLDAFQRQPGDDRKRVEVGGPVQPRCHEALFRRERQAAQVDAGSQHGLPRLHLRLISLRQALETLADPPHPQVLLHERVINAVRNRETGSNERTRARTRASSLPGLPRRAASARRV